MMMLAFTDRPTCDSFFICDSRLSSLTFFLMRLSSGGEPLSGDLMNEKQSDIVFLNAYYEWKISCDAENPTRERIAFGRLKALRSDLERNVPEVEAFDIDMERGGRQA